jgi:hypothetical protein
MSSTPEIKDLRYIVFLLSPEFNQYMSDGRKTETHDGYVFTGKDDAIEFAYKSVREKMCSRFVVGLFTWDKDREMLGISNIESFGFRHDKKNVEQLKLFV